ncbi:MAG: ComEA family DNA-binding protein [Acutalibacteraceae bacterium]
MRTEFTVQLSPVKVCIAIGVLFAVFLIGFNVFYTASEKSLEIVTVSEIPESHTEEVSGMENGQVNINTADAETLATYLKGIGTVLAQRIVDYRAEHGNFESIEDLKNVKGIGNAIFSKIKDKICV